MRMAVLKMCTTRKQKLTKIYANHGSRHARCSVSKVEIISLTYSLMGSEFTIILFQDSCSNQHKKN